MRDNDKFILTMEKQEKMVYVTVSGTFEPDDCNSFVEDYSKIVNFISPSEYVLKFNCTNLKASENNQSTGINMIEMLHVCLELYKKDGFKNVIFDCTGNSVIGTQLRRMGDDVGLPSIVVVK